jgi:hypothetical protein
MAIHSHEQNDFGAQILFLGPEGLFSLFNTFKYIFSSSIKNFQSMDMGHSIPNGKKGKCHPWSRIYLIIFYS